MSALTDPKKRKQRINYCRELVKQAAPHTSMEHISNLHTEIADAYERIEKLEEAAKCLLFACELHDSANGKQMVDPHAEDAVRAALLEMEK